MFDIELGMLPSKRFPPRSRNFKLENDPMPSGICPEIMLLDKSSTSKDATEPCGTTPVKLLLLRLRCRSELDTPANMSSGSCPASWLFERSMVSMWDKWRIEDDSLPEMFLPESSTVLMVVLLSQVMPCQLHGLLDEVVLFQSERKFKGSLMEALKDKRS